MVGVCNASGQTSAQKRQGGFETRKPETGLILNTGPLTSQPSKGEKIMSSTRGSIKKGIDKTADTLKYATERVADTIKDAARYASHKMKKNRQTLKDAVE